MTRILKRVMYPSALGCTADTYRAFQLIADERARQDERWGEARDRGLSMQTWLAILVEEVGELARTFLNDDLPERHTPAAQRKESIQVAAVATAIVEVLSGDKGYPTQLGLGK